MASRHDTAPCRPRVVACPRARRAAACAARRAPAVSRWKRESKHPQRTTLGAGNVFPLLNDVCCFFCMTFGFFFLCLFADRMQRRYIFPCTIHLSFAGAKLPHLCPVHKTKTLICIYRRILQKGAREPRWCALMFSFRLVHKVVTRDGACFAPPRVTDTVG